MSYRSLNQFIDKLKKENEIVVIKEFVDPVLQIAEITDRMSKEEGGGKALLFENNGTNFPVLINFLGSDKRICMALNVDNLDDVGKDVMSLLANHKGTNLYSKLKLLPELLKYSKLLPKVINGRGECQEIINTNPDLSILPILQCWRFDGGKFITFPLVHTKDPNDEKRNVGMYRIQIFEKDLTGMHWHSHKTGCKHYLEYKKLGKKMPIAIALGGDPVYTYSATAPLPEGFDEYMLAGYLRKQRVELVKCITQDVEVPRDVDIVIEGYIDPNEDKIIEGPFGDHTGFYSLADLFPKMHVTCITHRKDAVYPATIVGIPPQEDAWIGKATERIFLKPLKMAILPEIIDLDLPIAGVVHNLTVVKINKQFSYQQLKVMNSLWGAGQMMFNKILIIVDGNVDIHNYAELAKYISENVNPSKDIYFTTGNLDILDHSSTKISVGGKMCIDATKKFDDECKALSFIIHKSGLKPDVPEFLLTPDLSLGIYKQPIKKDFSPDLNRSEQNNNINEDIDIKNIKSKYPEIKEINIDLIKNNISVVIISIEKNRKHHIKDISENIIKENIIGNAKTIVFVDKEVDICDLFMVTWICCNNIDPQRDSLVVNSSKDVSHIFIDGTRKTKAFDGFIRDWPNVVVADDATIEHIDKIWDTLNIGKFIESPSLKYRRLKYSEGAVVEE